MHIYSLRCRVLTPHSFELQRRLGHTGFDARRELWIYGLGGCEAVLARPGGWDGDGVVGETSRHSTPDLLVEAMIVAKVQVIAAEAAMVLVRN